MSRIDGHARWVSPAVLELMNDLPKEVEGGQIVRDEQGKPTGMYSFLLFLYSTPIGITKRDIRRQRNEPDTHTTLD